MSDINLVKQQEMSDIFDILYKIQDYGHIFNFEDSVLDEPFEIILNELKKIEQFMDDSYGA